MNRRDAIGLVAAAFCSRLARAARSGDASSYGLSPAASAAANTTALQSCIKDNVGRQVTIPGADAEYPLAGRIVAPANTAIRLADGARLRWISTEPGGGAFLRSETRPGIEVLGDNFKLTGNGEIIGPSQGIYVAREIGVLCVGTNAPQPRRGFEISDGVRIRNWGSHGIATQFVRDITVRRVTVTDCGYAGMQFLSSMNGQVLSNTVGTIGPGASGNAYGIGCNHDSLNYDQDPQAAANGRLAANPFCTSFAISGNTVYDIPLWAGIDFHGAYECQVRSNNVYNCRHGILLQGGSNAAVEFAGEHNAVVGNQVTTARQNGEQTTITAPNRLGISVNGGKRIHHRSISVQDNSVDGYGDAHNQSCSIQHTFTSDAEIANNRITNWRGYACYSAYSDGTISGNTFGPVVEQASTACIFIAIGGGLRIVDNRHAITSGQGALYGLYVNTATDAPYYIRGNDFRSAVRQQYAGHGGTRLSPSQMAGGQTG